ncbi:MAG: tyrosine-type recombinase/integrase [Planctomycetaceae bacterium]|nr:tyrosine-type recombinase/integrase [Planctomycetaceae bacterium]
MGCLSASPGHLSILRRPHGRTRRRGSNLARSQSECQEVTRYSIKNAGLPVIPQKNLRHTVATILLGRKWPLKTVSNLLGHSNIQTTANFYGQFTDGIHSEAVADWNSAITPKGCAMAAPERKSDSPESSEKSQGVTE